MFRGFLDAQEITSTHRFQAAQEYMRENRFLLLYTAILFATVVHVIGLACVVSSFPLVR